MARFPAEIQYSHLQYLYSVLNVKCFIISIVLLLYRCGHATRYDWSSVRRCRLGRHGARTGTSSEQETNTRLEDSSSQHRTG